MLYYSLILTAIILVMANLSARYGKGWMAGFIICGCCFTCGGGVIFPVGALHLTLLAVHPYTNRAVKRQKYFPAISLAATATIYLIAAGYACYSLGEYAEMRTEYPIESMEDRLPIIEPKTTTTPLSEESVQSLSLLESRSGYREMRNEHLKMLHGDQVNLFINSPGFGVIRMMTVPMRGILRDPNSELAIPQPFGQIETGGSVDSRVPEIGRTDAIQLHWYSTLDFGDPQRFGYFRDRQHVAGFQSHRFKEVPRPNSKTIIDSIDLISLVLHDQPVAYVSDELPRMDKLRKGPTRPLNEFESSGLAKLRLGEELVVESSSSKSRMLGSIRSTKQCLDCHGGRRGDLLGAFSYTLK